MLYSRSPFKTFFRIFTNGLYGYPQDRADIGPNFFFVIDNQGNYLRDNENNYLIVNKPPVPATLDVIDNDGAYMIDDDGDSLLTTP